MSEYIVASGNLTITGNTILNNLTVNGTTTGITKTSVGLVNVDNTSDLNKPLSTATQTALNLKQNNLLNMPGTGQELLLTNYVKKYLVKHL